MENPESSAESKIQFIWENDKDKFGFNPQKNAKNDFDSERLNCRKKEANLTIIKRNPQFRNYDDKFKRPTENSNEMNRPSEGFLMGLNLSSERNFF